MPGKETVSEQLPAPAGSLHPTTMDPIEGPQVKDAENLPDAPPKPSRRLETGAQDEWAHRQPGHHPGISGKQCFFYGNQRSRIRYMVLDGKHSETFYVQASIDHTGRKFQGRFMLC
jgi:hypothetical protein